MNKTMKNKILVIGSVILGILFLALSFVYFTTPAGSLPSFIPGFEPGIVSTHVKHSVACFILSLALFIFAWFKSAKKA